MVPLNSNGDHLLSLNDAIINQDQEIKAEEQRIQIPMPTELLKVESDKL